MSDRDRFARLRPGRIWAVGCVHGEAQRLASLHDKLAKRIGATDRVVYLGNYLGVGPAIRATLDEMVAFRRWLLARPQSFLADLAFLRGAQEEMWSKLLQLHFAPNPSEVLRWLADHGAGATVEAYGGSIADGLRAAREGAVAISRWTGGLRSAVANAPGHTQFLSALRRAAYTDDHGLLFVHAGIDVSRPLAAQSDSFWWAAGAFARIDEPYEDFRMLVRGYDPAHAGLVRTVHTTSIDAGCGHGGMLLAVCFDAGGEITEGLDA